MKWTIKGAFLIFFCSVSTARSQIYIQQLSTLHLDDSAMIYVEGEIISFESISGSGIIYMKGESTQSINFNGFGVPKLSLDNTSGVDLSGDLIVGRNLALMGSQLSLNNFRITLDVDASITPLNGGSIMTNFTGVVRKRIGAKLSRYLIPLSNSKSFTPLILATSEPQNTAYVDVSSVDQPSSHKPFDVKDYADFYWKVKSYGVKGNLVATGIRSANAQSNKLDGYSWQNGQWQLGTLTSDGIIKVSLRDGESEVYGMAINRVNLYPNPANNRTTLVFHSASTDEGMVSITDFRGRIIYSQKVNLSKGENYVRINVRGFANGPYTVRLIQKEKSSIIKFVKQ